MAKPEISAVSITDCTETGGSDGQIEITAISGTQPYQYSLNGTSWQDNNLFTGLVSGIYALYVKDATAETDTIAGIKVGEPVLQTMPVHEVIKGVVRVEEIKGEVSVQEIRGEVRRELIRGVISIRE